MCLSIWKHSPATEQGRTRAGGHEIIQTGKPPACWGLLLEWPEGLLSQKELTNLRKKQHNSGAPTDMTDHMPRPWEAGNNCPQGFILGCDEGVVWDLGALMQQLRMQGTHTQATHISFPLPLPDLTHLFSFLTQSRCGAPMGSLLRKPSRSHTSLGLQPDTLRAQGEPTQGT